MGAKIIEKGCYLMLWKRHLCRGLLWLGGLLSLLGATTVQGATTADTATAKNVTHLTTTQQRYVDQQLRQKTHFTGTALLYKDGQVLYQKGYGYSNAATKRKNSANTMYEWGSIQKSLTGVLLMRLVEQGKVHLNDKLGQYYPTIAGGQQVTLRQMLDMCSGLTLDQAQTFASTEQGAVKFAVAHTRFDPAGLNRWDYQPINFLLLAGIVAKISGHTYAQEARQVVFGPLGLKHIGFMPAPNQSTWATSYRNSALRPYSYLRPERIKAPIYDRELGTGNLYSSAGDLLRLQQGVIHGKIISKASLADLRAGGVGPYRGGVYNYNGYIYGRGTISAYEAVFCLSDDGNTGVVLMGNRYFYNKRSPESVPSKSLVTTLYRYIQ